MCPPGLAMASVPERVLARAKPSRSFYFDWRANKKAQDELDAAFTPAVSLIRSLDVALGLILDDGLEAAFERHVRLGRAARAGMKAMGLELFSPDDDTAAVVTAVRAPEGIDGDELLLHLRDRHGVTLAPGQGASEGQDLPHRPHRLVRRLRHRDRARGGRALADRARRGHRARRRRRARVRGVRDARRRCDDARSSSASTIADAGVELLRERVRGRRRHRLAARGDHRRLRRADRPLGDEGDGRADRSARRG